MLYAIIGEHQEESLPRRLEARPAHLECLQHLQDQGCLVLAGPFPAIDSEAPGSAGFSGSLIVAEFDSQTEAQAWADADPYMKANVYRNVTVKPFCKVFPGGSG